MRHRDSRNRLTQKPAHARMLKRNLLTSILLYESVRTTQARAHAVQPTVDRIIALAKKHPPHVAIRMVNRLVTDKNACRKILQVYVKRYAKKNSGLTRIVPAGARLGDGAKLVDISFVQGEKVEVSQASTTKAKGVARPAKAKKTSAAPKKSASVEKQSSPPQQ